MDTIPRYPNLVTLDASLELPMTAIRGGVIANRTDSVVGLSNLFARREDGQALRAGGIEAVLETFPGCVLVGYESRRDLAELQHLGFQTLGPLRVWVRKGK
jgi:hypothetical protein